MAHSARLNKLPLEIFNGEGYGLMAVGLPG
jgi:hypothetical protein